MMNFIEKRVLKNADIKDKISRSLEPKDLIDFATQYSVLTEDEREQIEHEVTRSGRINKFLSFIRKKKDGFESLLKMLEVGGYAWMAGDCRKVRDQLRNDGVLPPVERIPEAARTRELDSPEMLDIAKFMVTKWKNVATRLGISCSDIYSIEVTSQNDGPQMAAFSALQKWTSGPSHDRNICKLLEVFDIEDIDYDEEMVVQMFTN